jgi:hypothetical protein
MHRRSLLPGGVVAALALTACHSDSDPDVPGSSPIVTNLQLAGGPLGGSGIRFRLAAASEAGEGRDLDGDGDTEDLVVQLLELFPPAFTNTGLALDPLGPLPAVEPEIDSSDALGVFVVNETATGRDANENGVPDERTTWVFDRRAGTLRDLPFLHMAVELDGELAAFWVPGDPGTIHVLDARYGSLTVVPDDGSLLLVREEIVAFLRPEAGAVDLTGDGDTEDAGVLQLYDARTRLVENTGWATHNVRWVPGLLALLVDEGAQGDPDLDGEPGTGTALVLLELDTLAVRIPRVACSTFASTTRGFVLLQDEGLLGDRNGDGDDLDVVPLVHDPRRDVTIAPGIAARPEVFEGGDWLGLSADQDEELLVLDLRTGAVQRLGLAGFWIGGLPGHLLALRPERGVDLNRDGDQHDHVLFAWSEREQAGRNVGLAVGNFAGSAFGQALLTVIESSQGADLNRDGDREDLVLTVFNAESGVVYPLALGLGGIPQPPSDFGSTVVPVSEPAQGVDLNGDGDMLDAVLHKVQVVQRID